MQRIEIKDEYCDIKLVEYGANKVWIEISNTDQGGFAVLTADKAAELSKSLLRFVDEIENGGFK